MVVIVNTLIKSLINHGANIIEIIDISELSEAENRGYDKAILIGLTLSPTYLFQLTHENDNVIDSSEFGEKEHQADELAEWAADFICSNGYKAFAQSERNLINGYFNNDTKTTLLPHKKIAILASIGWIGKNNLLVTKEYGCAVCMCTVLTNAPLPTENKPIIMPRCKTCTVCKNICPAKVIHGTTWDPGINRDTIIDVYRCDGCLKCLVFCPLTQQYMKRNVAK